MKRKKSESINSFEFLFSKEMMEGEKLRVTILFWIFFFSTIVFGLGFYFFSDRLILRDLTNTNRTIPAIFFGSVTLFYFILSKRISFAIKTNIEVNDYVRFFGAFIETSIPAVSIFYLGKLHTTPIVGLLTLPTFLFFIFIILSSFRLNPRVSIFTGFIAAIEYLGISIYALSQPNAGMPSNLLNPMIYVSKSIMFIIAGIATGFVTDQIRKRIRNSFQALEERNRITNIFGQHVSPSVVDKLLNQPNELNSESRDLCMMFFDIRDFTSFSEKRDPEEIVNYLNSVFEFIIEIINKHGGIINKFLGDGFMAVFGAPISSGEDAQNAVNASLEILRKLEDLETKNLILSTKIGIGLHAGVAVTGNVGSSLRKEYTIIGDVVNLASRIEQLNKQLNTQILMSSDVYDRLSEKLGEEYGEVKVKGRDELIKIFKLA